MGNTAKQLKVRRSWAIVVVTILLLIVGIVPGSQQDDLQTPNQDQPDVLAKQDASGELATDVLAQLVVKGRAPKTGYARDEFGSGWATFTDCDMRNLVLSRSMSEVDYDSDGCTVLQGVLLDPYTGNRISFQRGGGSSDAVQIDHVVALSDAWQKGAQEMSYEQRVLFANDPLNLLAVDGRANQIKGDKDAASWLPENKAFRCRYIARQIAVKSYYKLWVTEAEQAAMRRVLNSCLDQTLPVERYE